jgi:RND family efflux transporter MFP subunit
MTEGKPDLSALRIERKARTPRAPGWWFWLSLGLVGLAAAGATWRYVMGAGARSVRAMEVVVRQPAEGGQAVLNASGYVTARRRATVSSKVTGRVVEVRVDEGMRVRAGEVLARLDDTTERANLALAEAELAAARGGLAEIEVRLAEATRTWARRRQLLADGLIGQAELDAAEAEVDSLRARLGAAREQVQVAERRVALRQSELDATVIRAPFDGVAISKDAQPGEMVSPISAGGGFTRTGICTLVDMTSLEIEVDVNESYIHRVTPGQRVTAVLDAYPDWPIPAHVITTVPAADRQKATVRVRIGFDRLDSRILPDMGVKVVFHGPGAVAASGAAGRARVFIPRAAVRSGTGGAQVFVVRGDRLEQRAVRLGAVEGDLVEVLSGLTAGERVVTDGPPDLVDGERVVVGR